MDRQLDDLRLSDPRTTPMRAIPPALLERLRCPACGAAIGGGEPLACAAGHELARREGYLDASGTLPVDRQTGRTFASFGYEWTSFDRVQPEDEAFFAQYFADVHVEELAGRVGLDAGCGKGRFTRLMAPYLHGIVALDGSRAVVAAVRNLQDCENAVVLRADLRAAPLAAESFDFISCLGVLHHLADPRAGFDSLVRLLAPGGMLLVYLYSRPDPGTVRALALGSSAALRKLTVHLPHRVTRALAAPIAAALYATVVLPGHLGAKAGIRRLDGLPLVTYRGRPGRSLWLDTFDRLSAPIEKRYVWDEVRPWYEGSGLAVEAVSERGGLVILARRPPTG